ncbi:MAG: hypothetical protein LPK07_00630 [Hymenobacteraceae bacterium]|nr:hypothetical protein [Hymenobacteraceae bacterium]MDX5480168.1 hypothetical protein [Hymenobacteraceae bacterium]
MRHACRSQLFIFALLLLCACATQREAAEQYFDKHVDELAAYVDQNEEYKEKYGAKYAARHLPAKVTPPVIAPETKPVLVPGRLTPCPLPEPRIAEPYRRAPLRCPECRSTHTTETVYVQDTARLDALRGELVTERQAHEQTRQKLIRTETERDYWQDKNEKKFWALIAMAIFAALFILFRVLAARTRIS